MRALYHNDPRIVAIKNKYEEQISDLKIKIAKLEKMDAQLHLLGERAREKKKEIDADKMQIINKIYEMENMIAEIKKNTALLENEYKYGLLLPPRRKSHILHSKIEALHKQGLSLRKIASELDCSHNTVRNRLNEISNNKGKITIEGYLQSMEREYDATINMLTGMYNSLRKGLYCQEQVREYALSSRICDLKREYELLSSPLEALNEYVLKTETKLHEEKLKANAVYRTIMCEINPAYKNNLDTQEMIRLHNKGDGVGFIAKQLVCHVDTVRNRLKREGVY